MRFSYNSNYIQPSSIETNEKTTNPNEYFKFEDEFQNGALEMFTIPDESGSNIIRGVVSFVPPITEGDHIITEEGVGKVVDTTGGVRLGKMSFQTTEEKFNKSWFQLVPVEDDSPATGIKISRDGKKYYQANGTEDPDKNVFRFTDETASKNANLSNLVLSSGTINEIEPDQSTYKEYSYTPEFDPDILGYNLTLLEYIDNMDIKVTTEDEKSTLKMKVPKRDEENQLVYESDGTTIVYEEKEIQSNTLSNVTLNKLGEPNTNITIIVTAEDKKTMKEYTLMIERPYGTIRGKIQLGQNLRDSTQASYGITTKYIADVQLYKNGLINWQQIISEDITLEDVDLQTAIASSKSDDEGNYEIYVIPGTYDLKLERLGFLVDVTTKITINKEEVINMNVNGEPTILMEGDVDRSGMITLNDMVQIVNLNNSNQGDGVYQESGDFGQKGFISLADLVNVNNNMYNKINIREY